MSPAGAVSASRERLPRATPVTFRPPRFTTRQVSEGVSAVVGESHSTPLLHLRLAIPVGASSDPRGNEGLAALSLPLLLERMPCREGTQIRRQLGAWAKQLTAEAGWDSSYLSLEVQAHHWQAAIDLLAQTATAASSGSQAPEPEEASPEAPGFEALDRWRHRRQAQLQHRRHSPALRADDALARILYGSSPFGRCHLGTDAGLAAIEAADVEGWYRQSKAASGWAWVLTGPVDEDRVFRKLERALPGIHRLEPSPDAYPEPTAKDLGGSGEPGITRVVNEPSAAQAEVRLAAATVSLDHPDFLALLLLSHILGGGFASRLSTGLRESRGLAYRAFCRLEPRRGPSPWMASAAVAPNHAGEAMGQLRGEVERLRGELVPADELNAAKDSLIGLAQTALQSGRAVAAFLQHGVVNGLLDHLDSRYNQGIRSLEPIELQRLATQYLAPANLAGIVLGPRRAITESLRRAGEPLRYERPDPIPQKRDNGPLSRGAATYSKPKGGERND